MVILGKLGATSTGSNEDPLKAGTISEPGVLSGRLGDVHPDGGRPGGLEAQRGLFRHRACWCEGCPPPEFVTRACGTCIPAESTWRDGRRISYRRV